MKLTVLFLKYTGLYLLFKIMMVVALVLLNIRGNSAVAIVTIIFATRVACDSFTKKNDIFFSKNEFWKVVFGFSFINMVFAAAGTYLMLTTNSIQITQPVIIALIIEVGLLHTVGIYFIVRSSGKRFEHRMSMHAYNNQIEVYSTRILSEAHILKDIIESNGISCDIRTEDCSNRTTGGELPLITESSLWISDASKRDEASPFKVSATVFSCQIVILLLKHADSLSNPLFFCGVF